MFLIDTLILVTGVLVLLGIASSKLSLRLGLPVLVLFLLLGMLAGSEGIGGIPFDNFELAHGIGTLALAMILFDGGLSTSLSAVRLVWKPAAVLATLGVLVTAVITGAAAAWILEIPLLEGLLLGSIVGSTDAAAVFSVLRSGGVSLPNRIASVLEVESASNDPMAIFLTVGCIELLLGHVSPGPGLLRLFLAQMFIGGLIGVLGGYIAAWVANRIELGAAGLYPVLISSFCLLIYGLAAQLGGSGFLAVFIAGVLIGNQRLVFQRGIRLFHDAIAWLSQIVMFVILGLLCFPSRLLEVGGKALVISIILILAARPVAVLLTAFPFRFTAKELTFISWVGLKGAVPITLATFPLMLATPDVPMHAPLLFDVVFFIVVISAIVQGSSLAPVARWLGLERPLPPEPPVTLEISSLRHVDGEIVDYAIGEDSLAAGRLVKDLALPEGVVIAMIARENQIIPPQGKTEIRPGDHVILVMRPGTQARVSQIFASKPQEPEEITPAITFPLRASTTVAELQEMYGIQVEAPQQCSLAETMQRELGADNTAVGSEVEFGPLVLTVQQLNEDGAIEMVTMSIRPTPEPAEAQPGGNSQPVVEAAAPAQTGPEKVEGR